MGEAKEGRMGDRDGEDRGPCDCCACCGGGGSGGVVDSTGTEPVGDVLRLFGAEDSIVGESGDPSSHGCHHGFQTREAGENDELRRVPHKVLRFDASDGPGPWRAGFK